MEQSPSETTLFAASQWILLVLWNPRFHYRFHKCTSPAPTRSQLNPAQTPTSHNLNFHHIIIFTSKSGSTKWSLSLRFRQQTPLNTSAEVHDSTADANSADVGWHFVANTNGTSVGDQFPSASRIPEYLNLSAWQNKGSGKQLYTIKDSNTAIFSPFLTARRTSENCQLFCTMVFCLCEKCKPYYITEA